MGKSALKEAHQWLGASFGDDEFFLLRKPFKFCRTADVSGRLPNHLVTNLIITEQILGHISKRNMKLLVLIADHDQSHMIRAIIALC